MPRHQSGYVGGVAGFIAACAALLSRSHQSEFERVDVSEVERLLTLFTLGGLCRYMQAWTILLVLRVGGLVAPPVHSGIRAMGACT